MEFAIVVGGVFIGIQASNWNQARLERAEERRYYDQIVADLRTDQVVLQNAVSRANRYDLAAEQTLAALRTGNVPKGRPGMFAANIHYAGFLYLPHPARRTYDELVSTGNLGLLRDQSLKAEVASYYARFEANRQWDDLLRMQQDRYWHLTAGVVPRPVLQAALRFEEPRLSVAEAEAVLREARSRDGIEDLLIGMAAHQERVRRDARAQAIQGRALIGRLQMLTR